MKIATFNVNGVNGALTSSCDGSTRRDRTSSAFKSLKLPPTSFLARSWSALATARYGKDRNRGTALPFSREVRSRLRQDEDFRRSG